MTTKNWSCDWTGPRGGKWWTGYVTEEEARAKFESIGEKCPATLWERTSPFGGNLLLRVERAKNKRAEIKEVEKHLKSMMVRRDKINKGIREKRSEIEKLEKEIKEINSRA